MTCLSGLRVNTKFYLSQKELCAIADLKVNRMTRIECGYIIPRLEEVERWSKALEVPTASFWILFWTQRNIHLADWRARGIRC